MVTNQVGYHCLCVGVSVFILSVHLLYLIDSLDV